MRSARYKFTCVNDRMHNRYIAGVPVIANVDSQAYATVGSIARLTCPARGHPQPVVSWRHENRILPGSDRRLSLFSNSTLKISSVSSSDAGEYTCTATNSQGSASHKVTLIIEGCQYPVGKQGSLVHAVWIQVHRLLSLRQETST